MTTIPLYGFVAGDALGVLVLIDEDDTIAELAQRLQAAAQVRVAPRPEVRVHVRGRPLERTATVKQAGLVALDRVDLDADTGEPGAAPGVP
jgi:hypothetical protein